MTGMNNFFLRHIQILPFGKGVIMSARVSTPNFSKIVDNLAGAEGPVFDKNGVFYMVAPEVEKDGAFAGQVFKVDVQNYKVCFLHILNF